MHPWLLVGLMINFSILVGLLVIKWPPVQLLVPSEKKMKPNSIFDEKKIMYTISARVAILGAVGYQYFVKKVPESINPVISVLGIYVSVLVLGVLLLFFIPPEGGIVNHIRQLNWIQLAIAVSVLFLELGFLSMYRAGWNLNTGNLVTGVFVNIILVVIGLVLLGEKMSLINSIGVILSIIGVALISYKP